MGVIPLWRCDLMKKLLADKEMTNKEPSEILIMGSVNDKANSSKIVMRSTASRREAATAGFCSNIFLAASVGYSELQIEEILKCKKPNVPPTRQYHNQAMDVAKKAIWKERRSSSWTLLF